jgi:hypothetical protein
MSTAMVATTSVTTIYTESRVYKSGKDGIWDIDDADVQAMRAHGLVLPAEQADGDTVGALQKQLADAQASQAALQKQIADITAANTA